MAEFFKRVHPIFIALFVAWCSTPLLTFLKTSFEAFRFLDGMVYWQPGLAFGIAVGLIMRKPIQFLLFVALSTGTYFQVVNAYASGVYGGAVWYLVGVLMVGALLELLLFAAVYGFFKRLKPIHFIGALLAAVISFLCMDLHWNMAFLVWYLVMGAVFYTLIERSDDVASPPLDTSNEL